MNKKSVILKSIALTSIFVLNVGLLVNLNRVAVELDAYDIADLPTTIDLNDCTDEQIRTYYSSLNSLDVSQRQGTNLLKNLKTILKNGQKYLSYDDKDDRIWDAYCIVDRDWEKSPASALPSAAGTYDAQENKIMNYHWGKNSSTYENPYLHALYYNRENEPIAQAYGDHRNGADNPRGINREHIWPKGAGFHASGSGGARGDLMHLWAANGHTNNKHSNYYYGYVDQNKSFDDEETDIAACAGNLLGLSKTLGGSTKVFEPQDSDKGDIARACFYMAARYNNYAGNDTVDTNNPNLQLVNDLSSWSNSGYTCDSNTIGKLGIIQDLLDWNRIDPPDEFEIHRNNLCYNNFTNNRNPFIDFPSWADAIWGIVDEYGNYNQTPSGSASPTSDPINAGVVINNFSISNSELELVVGGTAELSANHADGDITWTVEDGTVVSLDKNSTANNEAVTVTALKSGSTTITATNGGDSLSCTVTVREEINYGTLEHPLTVDEALEVIDITGTNATAKQITVKGIATSSSAYNDEYKNFDYVWLQSNDGSNAQALQLFRIFASDDIYDTYGEENSMVGKEVVAEGYGMIYKGKYEIYKSGNTQPYIKSVTDLSAPTVDDYLVSTTPYLGLLATEGYSETPHASAKFSDEMSDKQALGNTFAIGDVNLAGALGTHANAVPKYYSNGSALRIYAGNTLTFTSTYQIKRIEFTFVQNNTSDLTPNNGEFDLDTLSGVWTGSSTSVVFSVDSNSRLSSVSVTYGEPTFMVSDVALRFGVVFPKADWTSIYEKWSISDYGVMIVKKMTLNTAYGVSTIAKAHENGEYLLDIHRGSYAEPWSMNEDNYAFTVKLSMTLEESYAITYCAAPYIIAGGTYYFLDQIETSVNDLADYYLNHGGSSLSDEALTLLSITH